MKLVKIIWSDIESNNQSWTTIQDAIEFHKEPTLIEQVGFIIFDDGDTLIITDSYCAKLDLIGSTTRIPNQNIVDIMEL